MHDSFSVFIKSEELYLSVDTEFPEDYFPAVLFREFCIDRQVQLWWS